MSHDDFFRYRISLIVNDSDDVDSIRQRLDVNRDFC